MTHVIRTAAVLFAAIILAIVPASAQDAGLKSFLPTLIDVNEVPDNFAAFGAGLHSGGNLSGGTGYCHSIGSFNFACAVTRYSGSTTASTIELKQVVFARSGVIGWIDGNAGIATGADNGIGGAFSAGGGLMVRLDKLKPFRSLSRYYLGAEGAWDKRDVKEFISGPTARSLRDFGARGTYGFFVAYGW